MARIAADSIDADTISIGDLLSSDHKLNIPAYQRPYDWTKDEASEFLDDLKIAREGGYAPFFGTIVLDISNSECLDIIDGQQRITTFNLFLIAVRATANKNGTREDISLATKINSVLNYDDRSSGRTDNPQSRLLPSISIKDLYLLITQNEEWDGKFTNNNKFKKQARKIKPVLDYFLEQLAGLHHDDLSALLDRLYKGYVVALRITNKTQALEIFEHANVRGMELNAGDLLKSFFITNISDQSDTELENKWIEIVSNTGNIIRMIKHFGWTLFNKKVVANRNGYYASLKKLGDEVGPEAFLNTFDAFAQAYGIIENGDIEQVMKWAEANNALEIAKEKKAYSFIRSLKGIRLFRIVQAYPLLASALVSYKGNPTSSAANAVLELADFIEKYHFINSYICQRRGNEVETLYADMCRQIASDKGDLAAQINELKNKLKNQLADFKEFKPKFAEISYDSSAATLKSIYYIFDRLENSHRSGREIEEIYNPRLAIVKGDWEVEHILSQNPAEAHAIENADEVIHSIGNLLVVPNGTNKAVGNRPVAEKIPIYRKKVGKLASVMDFCTEYDDGDYGAFHCKEDVDARTDSLARKLYGTVFTLSKEQSKVLTRDR